MFRCVNILNEVRVFSRPRNFLSKENVMKTKLGKNLRAVFFLMAILILAISVTTVCILASDGIEVIGEMVDIKTAFADKLVQSTAKGRDSYVGEYQYTVYYDTAKGTVKTGYEGTPVVIYTINHPEIERVGTDDNETIISSMLDRGYVVIVLDYLNNKKALSPDIETSAQNFRKNVIEGGILNVSSVLPSGKYYECFVAPSGCNVLLNQVFWEIDKHSAEGTLEKIVENWNSDFRATKGSKLVKWVHEDGTRKATQKDFEGNSPAWYDSNGARNDQSGQYTYVRFTKAEVVTDCVDPDGSLIDMNLYIHVVYPTNPASEVPVMALANSSGRPTTAVTGADLRPHSNGFLYNGYANVVFDYLWEPMARDASWGYYDGSQGVTQDHMNYALMMYNDKLVNTAAMRYLRYLSMSGGKTYNFDLDAFGVYGNSKGGWFSYLGEQNLQSPLVDASKYSNVEALEDAITDALAELVPDRYYEGHHGETRYQVGATSFTKDGFTIKAGEQQPWLTYNGVEIISGCQLTNACNGSQEEDITAGHSPVFISGNMTDTYNAAYSYSVNIYNICRELDIPLLHFEVPIGHTLTSGPDMNYNVDTYDAYFRYVNYYLKGTPISVAYVSPMDNAGAVKLTEQIKIGFAGAATLDQVKTITVSANGAAVEGAWESSFGGTVWTFVPKSLKGSTEYTITVPKGFKGDNGAAMAESYSVSFITEADKETELSVSGDYYTLTAPSFTFGNTFVFRFNVTNDAANVAKLYAVNAIGDTEGELLGSVNLRSNGSYEIDVTDYMAANSGKKVVLYLKTAKTAGDRTVKNESLSGALPSDLSINSKVSCTTSDSAGGRTCLGVYVKTPTEKDVSVYYDNPTQIFTYKKITGGEETNESNLGRRYTVGFDVYDTQDRVVVVKLNSMTKRVDYGTIDYNQVQFNVKTKSNEWTRVEFTYDVYEADYGLASVGNVQALSFYASPDGDTNGKLYISGITVVEHITDMQVGFATVAEKDDGSGAYKAPTSSKPFAIYNGSTLVGEYSSWRTALGAYSSGYTIKLQCDYSLTDTDLYEGIGNFSSVNVDLGFYTITCSNTKGALIWAKATSTATTSVNLTGGKILLGRTPLISYEGSTSAGAGKKFNFNLNGCFIGVKDHSMAIELISKSSSAVAVESVITLDECTVKFRDSDRVRDAVTIMPGSTGGVDLAYNVIGGSICIDSQRWVTILDNAKTVEFLPADNGDFTTLLMPASVTKSVSGSYLMPDGYATFERSSVKDNVATYVLEKGENSTRYGVITSEYADPDKYPYLLFKDGVLISGHGDMKDVITAASNLLKGEEHANDQVEILLRKDMTTQTEPSHGGSAGTIVFDLGGHTLNRGKVIINAVITSGTPMYETNLVYKNGRIETSKNVVGVFHLLYTTTQVKTFNITFENITFGFNSALSSSSINGPFWTVWHNNHTTKVNASITLRDCTIDLANNAPTSGNNLFLVNNDRIDCDFRMEGGEISGNGSGYKLCAIDSLDSVTVGKGVDGKYPVFISKNGGSPISENYLCDDGVYRNFVQDENDKTLYNLEKNDLVTSYGAISPEYADAEKYPFALFFDGQFVGAYTHFANTQDSDANNDAKDVLQYAKSKISGASASGKTAYILLRRNYVSGYLGSGESYNNLSQIGGELVLDLGGFTYSTGSTNIFAATGKSTSGAFHDSAITVKNGTFLLGTKSLVYFDSASALTSTKSFNFRFENVSFVAEKTSPASIIATASGKGTVDMGANVTFDGCTFDYTDTAAHTLFNLTNNTENIAVTVKILGGTLKTNSASMSAITLVKCGSNDSFCFAKGTDGKYISMIYPSAEASITDRFTLDSGEGYFVKQTDDGTNAVYTLASLATPYGTVPHDTIVANPAYLSAIEYPFFVFEDGVFVGAATTWKNAVTMAKNRVAAATDTNETVEILMRRDYSITKAQADNGNNFNNARGIIVADLGGYTIDAIDTYFIDIYVNYSTTSILNFKSTLLLKNGTLKNSRDNFAAIGLGHTGTAPAGYSAKEIAFLFENVTFISPYQAIIDDFSHTPATGLKIEFKCEDCTFDFTGAKKDLMMFDFSSSKTNVVVDLVFTGGKIITSDFANNLLYTVSSEDKVVVNKGKDGVYMTLVQLTASAAPLAEYLNAKGLTLSFGKDRSEGVNTVYVLGEPIETPYGYIPFKYQSAELYPFAVFDEKGNFINISDCFIGANSAKSAFGYAKDYLAANYWNGTSYGENCRAAYILLRRDFTMQDDARYDNVAQVQGSLVIDLGGFTLTAPKARPILPACAKPWGGSGDAAVFPTEISFKNGDIVLVDSPIFTFDVWGGSSNIDVSGKVFSFTFEQVDFSVKGSTKNFIGTFSVNSQTPNAIANPEVKFIDCSIDLSSARSDITVFNLGTKNINLTVTVVGGSIVIDGEEPVLINKLTETKGQILWGSDDGVDYTDLILSGGALAPAGEITLANGAKGAFIKLSESDGKEIYTVNPTSEEAQYIPEMSLTLDSDVIMNVYLPAEGLISFKLDGADYTDLSKLAENKVTVSGKEYYRMSIPLTSASAARDVSLTVTSKLTDEQFTESFTLSVVKYAKQIIEQGSATEATLMRDVLSYIRAAYAYFGSTDTSAITTIDAIIGKNYDEENKPQFSQSTDTPASLEAAAFVLGATPAVRFYLPEGANASDYQFYIGANKLTVLEGTDKRGRYLEIEVYAYAMCEVFECKLSGASIGTYSLASYYSFAKTTGDEKLVRLVERFERYSESAKSYRDEAN